MNQLKMNSGIRRANGPQSNPKGKQKLTSSSLHPIHCDKRLHSFVGTRYSVEQSKRKGTEGNLTKKRAMPQQTRHRNEFSIKHYPLLSSLPCQIDDCFNSST